MKSYTNCKSIIFFHNPLYLEVESFLGKITIKFNLTSEVTFF